MREIHTKFKEMRKSHELLNTRKGGLEKQVGEYGNQKTTHRTELTEHKV